MNTKTGHTTNGSAKLTALWIKYYAPETKFTSIGLFKVRVGVEK